MFEIGKLITTAVIHDFIFGYCLFQILKENLYWNYNFMYVSFSKHNLKILLIVIVW